MPIYIVYGLIDPRTTQLRYIGQTCRSLKSRLSQHLRDARSAVTRHCLCWIRGVVQDGSIPEIIELERFSDHEECHEAEYFWIEYYRSIGCDLVNRALGGRTRKGWRHSAEQREKWCRERVGEKASNYGNRWNEKSRAALSESIKKVWTTRPHPQLGRAKSPEEIEKIKKGRAANPPKVTEAGRQARAEASRRMWKNPDHRKNFSQKMSGENNPNFGKTMLPHVLAAILANTRRGFKHSEETKQKMREAALRRREVAS